MSNKSAVVRARIAPELKDEAEAILDDLGLTHSQAIAMFYRQVALLRGLPFDVRLPNETTLAAMREAEDPSRLPHHASVDELFDELEHEPSQD